MIWYMKQYICVCVCVGFCLHSVKCRERKEQWPTKRRTNEWITEWRKKASILFGFCLFIYFYLKAKKMRFSFSFANVHTKRSNLNDVECICSRLSHIAIIYFEHIHSIVWKECTLCWLYFLFVFPFRLSFISC